LAFLHLSFLSGFSSLDDFLRLEDLLEDQNSACLWVIEQFRKNEYSPAYEENEEIFFCLLFSLTCGHDSKFQRNV